MLVNVEHLNNPAPHVSAEAVQVDLTPEAFLQHFVASFYDVYKGETPSGFYTAMRNNAVEGAWWRGHAIGEQKGYEKAMHDMQHACGEAGEFLQTLMLK